MDRATFRETITRLLTIGMVAWVEFHLVMLLCYDRVYIYEDCLWILILEIVLVGLLLILRVESYVRMIIGALKRKSER